MLSSLFCVHSFRHAIATIANRAKSLPPPRGLQIPWHFEEQEVRRNQQRSWNEADRLRAEEKLTRVEADLARARHEVEERLAELDTLKTQVRRKHW